MFKPYGSLVFYYLKPYYYVCLFMFIIYSFIFRVLS